MTSKPGAMPKSVNCHICGKAFGTASIHIHIKACQEKFELEQAKKPPKERRKCPPAPPELAKALGKGPIDQDTLNAVNDANFRQYKESLQQCPACGRSFNDDAFKTQQRICKGQKPPANSRPELKNQHADPQFVDNDDFEDMIRGQFKNNARKNEPTSGATAKTAISKTTTRTGTANRPEPAPRAFQEPREASDAGKFAKQPVQRKTEGGVQQKAATFNVAEYAEEVPGNQCRKCGRKFAMDRIDKHEKVCVVNKKAKKVKLFHKKIT